MKKIALVGGIGPEATLDYYRAIIDSFKADYDTLGYPEMVIESLDMKTMLSFAEAGNWREVARIIAASFEALRRAGADFGAMAANTPHIVFDDIQAATSLPLISIVTATCNAVRARNIGTALLLGTRFTMQADFYSCEFAKADIRLVVPEPDEQDYIHEKLFSELEHGIVRSETRQGFIDIVNRASQDRPVQGIVSACTEFPLVMKDTDFPIDFFDTTAIHVSSIVDYARS